MDIKRFMGPNARELLYRDRIDSMGIDNESLQRRLGSVNNELNRIRSEKDSLLNRLRHFETENSRFDRAIHEKDELDMHN